MDLMTLGPVLVAVGIVFALVGILTIARNKKREASPNQTGGLAALAIGGLCCLAGALICVFNIFGRFCH
jgi:uncharacterized membrane protein